MRGITYKEFPLARRFGVELELSNNLSKEKIATILTEFEACHSDPKDVMATFGKEGWAHTSHNNYWHVKFDRTCGPLGKDFDHGWEVASFIGSGYSDIDRIARAARWLSAAGAETNLNCGLHVHVEVKDFDVLYMSNMLARWLKVEDILIKICDKSRWNNEHCQPLRKRVKKKKIEWSAKNLASFWQEIKPVNLQQHNNKDKKFTINTIGFAIAQGYPSYDRNTIELRLPECILDENHVRNWVRLILQFVESSRQTQDIVESTETVSNLDDFLCYMGLQSPHEFMVLDKELIGLKIWLLNKLSASNHMAEEAKTRLDFISQLC